MPSSTLGLPPRKLRCLGWLQAIVADIDGGRTYREAQVTVRRTEKEGAVANNIPFTTRLIATRQVAVICRDQAVVDVPVV